jgi:predicted permease
MNHFIYQQKQAWASLKLRPGFSAIVITTLAITLGALLCVLTLAYVLIAKPLPYPEQEKLFYVEHQLIDHNAKVDGNAFTYPNLMYLYKNQTQFSKTALMYIDAAVLTSHPSQPRLINTFVTPEWFSLFDSKMALGRGFEQSEALNSLNPVAVLSYASWQQTFAGDPNILAQKITLAGVSYRIVGVLAKTFVEPALIGPGNKSQVYLPWDHNSVPESERQAWGNDDGGLMIIGKTAGTHTQGQMQQALANLINDNWQQQTVGTKFFKGWSIGIKIKTLKSVILNDSQKTVYLLLAAVIGLVLIACVNITNLFMSRTAEQQQQMAIHAALGAKKSQLFAYIFAQTSILLFVSVLLALLVASGGLYIFQTFLNHYLPRVDELVINGVTFTCALIIGFLLAWFFARVSSNMIRYKTLNASLQSSGKGTSLQVSQKTRQLLVVSQVMIVFALVFVNLVLLKSSMNTIGQRVGIDTDNTAFFVLGVSGKSRDNEQQRIANISQLKSHLLALPQVVAVSQSSSPLMGFGSHALSVLGSDKRYSIKAKDVDHQYFQLLQQPLLQGRYFSAADIQDSTDVVIINDVFAKQLAPQGSAIGITFEGGRKVIGIVKGVNVPGQEKIVPRFYYPASAGRNMMLVKLKPNQALSPEQLVSSLKQASNELSLFSLSTLSQRKNSLLFAQYTTAITSAVLTLLTFLLAAIGVYGILNYATGMRRFEIGTRMAIGAKRGEIVAMVIKDNSFAILSGICAGFMLLVILFFIFSTQLYSYLSLDLLLQLLITLVSIAVIALFACYWPLRPMINRPVIYCLRGPQ